MTSRRGKRESSLRSPEFRKFLGALPFSPSVAPDRSGPYLKWIRLLPCVACETTFQIEPAHTYALGPGGMSQKSSDFSAIPLCKSCHTQSGSSYHRLGEKQFERRLGRKLTEIVANLRDQYRMLSTEPLLPSAPVRR